MKIGIVALGLRSAEPMGVGDSGGAALFVEDALSAYQQLGHRAEIFDHAYSLVRRELLRFDILHVCYWRSAAAVNQFDDLSSLKILYSPISLGVAKARFEPVPASRLAAESLIIRRASAIGAVSDQEAGDLVDTFGYPRSQITAVMRAVDLAIFRPQEESERAGFLFVGRYSHSKGIDLLLEAYAEYVHDHARPESLTIIGGTASQAWELESRIRIDFRLPASCVSVCPAQPQSIVSERMRHALAVVLPSRYEPGARVILEAFASGTPVLMTETGYASELRQATGVQWHRPLSSGNTSEWCHAMNALSGLSSEELLSLSAKCRRFAEANLTQAAFSRRLSGALDMALT